MNSSIERFAETARRFCAWAEGEPQAAAIEANIALRLLYELQERALQLPEGVVHGDPDELSHEAWTVVFRRFGSLPFNYYVQQTDPFVFEDAGHEVGDIADDLADIWRDLKGGLSLFDAGLKDAAASHWWQYFWIHWGRHAASCLYPLQYWIAERREDIYEPRADVGVDAQ
ncbi:DUF5063 domain-containing protein [Lysobacter antibioticus]|uniref:DUF5063 domain-containing protein n=1 Tax=Lysobacter antibioticus TaxID=84531 RepID=UPI0004D012C9|nr:DUF5063 domain-containing protein [Lysobacter antibioticus]